jgi:hypothetical protein
MPFVTGNRFPAARTETSGAAGSGQERKPTDPGTVVVMST